jgi:hypothetical protein
MKGGLYTITLRVEAGYQIIELPVGFRSKGKGSVNFLSDAFWVNRWIEAIDPRVSLVPLFRMPRRTPEGAVSARLCPHHERHTGDGDPEEGKSKHTRHKGPGQIYQGPHHEGAGKSSDFRHAKVQTRG